MSENSFDNINLSGGTVYQDSCISDSTIDMDDLSMKQQIQKRYEQDTRFRKHLAHWVMYIVPVWLGCVLFIITFNNPFCFNLDSKVLITLLATTTVNVLGLAYIVLKGIFPQK